MKKPAPTYSRKRVWQVMLAPRLPSWIPTMGQRTRLILGLVILSNVLSHSWVFMRSKPQVMAASHKLYLIDEASAQIEDHDAFAEKVKQIAQSLEVAPEWLMAVMYMESKFDASVLNYKGSGAVGLIQFMPKTAEELGVTPALLRNMPPTHQLDYVYKYLAQVKGRYGNYKNLTSLYLGILYPKAMNQDPCYTLFGKPSRKYRQNSGLDENGDGYVTVSDIDKRMMRIFPSAYHKTLINF